MATVRRAEHTLVHAVLGQVAVAVYDDSQGQAVVLRYGNPPRTNHTLVRIQAACTYGDVLLAADCDCRDQLNDTFRHFLDRGSGILIYVNHVERGGGLVNKAKAYEQHDREGIETLEAYERLDLRMDDFDYRTAAEILEDLEVRRIELLTNNNRKIDALQTRGLTVRRMPLGSRVTEANLTYLQTKERLGHQLELAVAARRGETAFRPKCFVVGAAVTDHIYRIGNGSHLSGTRQSNHYLRRPGGKGLNQAIALARLGADASLLTVRGHDNDGDVIAATLVAEGVRGLYVGTSDDGVTTPQTTVMHQPGGSIYVGWLGQEHRTLRRNAIDEHSGDIGQSRAILLTLEASADAIARTMRCSRGALVVLNASPVVESPYELSPETVEGASLVVGSADELAALLNMGRRPENEPVDGATIARELADATGVTVVLTSFDIRRHKATAYIPRVQHPVAVSAPRVLQGNAPDSVGASDVFCAALALSCLRLADTAGQARSKAGWRSPTSPLRQRDVLTDMLISAMSAEAWVTKSSGGFASFPLEGEEFDEWCREFPPIADDG